MDYTAWSVIYGEQPSASKWNLLGSNDAAFYTALTEGWIAAGETWTYASSTSFTVTGDQTAKYRTGVRIRLKQGGSFKYFVVVTSSYSNPTTTVTVQDAIDGSTYTVANAAITDNAYSMALMPQGFPLTADVAAFGSGTGWRSAQEETWTYASAGTTGSMRYGTFTISGDVTGKYNVMDKVRFKQGGAYKYFKIFQISYSAPNTTVRIVDITGTYTLANAVITDNYYSKAETPAGFPTKQNSKRLAYAEVTANQGSITTETDLTNLTAAVEVPTGAKIRIIGRVSLESSANDNIMRMLIKEGATNLSWVRQNGDFSGQGTTFIAIANEEPSAGAHTYKLTAIRDTGAGTVTMTAGSEKPGFISVELV